MPAIFPDTFGVRVFSSEGGPTLVAAVELVTPGNKDRADSRHGFAIKCGSYLQQGIGLAVVDIVTSRHFNLHNELIRLLNQDVRFLMPDNVHLYATAYGPIRRGERAEIDVWPHALALDQALPTLPLRITGELCVPLDLEATYADVCRRRVE